MSTAETLRWFDDMMAINVDQDGYNGQILDLVGALRDLPGEDYTDGQCLQFIHALVNRWSEVVDL